MLDSDQQVNFSQGVSVRPGNSKIGALLPMWFQIHYQYSPPTYVGNISQPKAGGPVAEFDAREFPDPHQAPDGAFAGV